METGDSNKDGLMTLEEYKGRYKFRPSDSPKRNLYLSITLLNVCRSKMP